MQAAMKLQILAPQIRPQRGVKDFAESHRQPVQEPGLAPAASDSFDPIDHAAEARLGDVCRERNPALMVQPVIEKRQRLPREVQEVRPRFRITALRQRRQQLAKAAPDRSGELADQRLVLGFQRFQLRLPKVEERIAVQEFQELSLGRAFNLIGVEKKTKVVMTMPDATLTLHPRRAEVVLDARPAVGKQHPQTPIVQMATEVSANRFPVVSHPEPHQFKRFTDAFRGPRPAHLHRFERGSSALAPDLGPVDHQKRKRPLFERRPAALRFRHLLKPAPERAFARPVAAEASRLLHRPSVGQMDGQAHRRFQRLPLVLPIRFDLQPFDQREDHGSRRPIQNLSHPVTNPPERSYQVPSRRLMAVQDITTRRIIGLGLLFQGFQDPAEDGPHDFIPVVLQSTEKTVDREVVFWYLIGDGDLDFEVVHWATPPSVVVNIMEGCSPFFSSLSNAIT